MKINILWQFRDDAWGGGNQFLKVLRDYWIDTGCYCEDPLISDVVLVNSKENLSFAIDLKIKYHKTCIHRIDGIFSLYRGLSQRCNDVLVYDFSDRYADGVVFQSEWARGASKQNGMKSHSNEVVIRNCSDHKIFYKNGLLKNHSKTRLVTTVWSTNPKKGFGFYGYLDAELDFGKYEYVLIGRTPSSFRNIKEMGVLTSCEIANELRNADVFVTASEDDACSNSLIEALSCGLPAVVLDSGGSPEILGSGGETFGSKTDIVDKIDMVSNNLNQYRSRVIVDRVDVVGKRYYSFMKKIWEEQCKNKP